MAKINLLPWRAERRERRKREFFSQLIVAAVAAVLLVLLWGLWMSWRISDQDSRNTYLTGQIQQLDAKIAEIKNLQQVKDHLLARKRIIEKLQSSRSQMVHLFDEIVKTIPSGARVTALKQQGDKLTLDGVAQSNATVAEYMRNIEASPWMGPAQLVKTENVHTDSNTPYEFELVVTLGTPKSDKDGATPASASSIATAATTGIVPLASASAPVPMAAAATPAKVDPQVATSAQPTGSAPPVAAKTSAATAPAPSSPAAASAPAASTTKGGARP